MKSVLLEDSVISAIAARLEKTPTQVPLAWAVQRGRALLTTLRNSKFPSSGRLITHSEVTQFQCISGTEMG